MSFVRFIFLFLLIWFSVANYNDHVYAQDAGDISEDASVEFNFNNIELKNLVDIISENLGITFLFSEKDLAGKKATLISNRRYSIEDTYAIFEAILELNGLTLIRFPDYVQIANINNARKIQTPLAKKSTSEIQGNITRVVQLKYIDTASLIGAINPFISRSTVVTQYVPKNTLIIRDIYSNIDRLLLLIDQIDRPDSNFQIKTIDIGRVSPSQIIALINNIFINTAYAKKSIFIFQQPNTNLLTVAAQKNQIVSIIDFIADIVDQSKNVIIQTLKVNYASAADIVPIINKLLSQTGGKGAISSYQLIIDKRTNSIVTISTPEMIEEIKLVIKQLDTPLEQSGTSYQVFRLNNASAKELAAVLQQATQSANLSLVNSAGASTTADAKATQASSNTQNQGAQNQSKTVVVADEATNSLVIFAEPSELPVLAKVIEDLDKPRPQVFVEALIMEMSLDKSLLLGVDWKGSALATYQDQQGVATFSSTNRVSNPDLVAGAVAAAPTGTSIGLLGPAITYGGQTFTSFSAFIRASQTDSEINILSLPQITALNNQEAEINVGEVRPFSTGTVTDTNGKVTNTIEYQQVGIDLKITPQINPDNSILLKIEQSSKEVVASLQSSTQNLTPNTKDRKIKTSIEVKDGETIVIGGLVSDAIEISGTKIPCLGDIPFLGWFFKSTSTTKRKNNLIVFMTPKIVRNYDFEDINNRAKQRLSQSLDNELREKVAEDYNLATIRRLLSEFEKDEEDKTLLK